MPRQTFALEWGLEEKKLKHRARVKTGKVVRGGSVSAMMEIFQVFSSCEEGARYRLT